MKSHNYETTHILFNNNFNVIYYVIFIMHFNKVISNNTYLYQVRTKDQPSINIQSRSGYFLYDIVWNYTFIERRKTCKCDLNYESALGSRYDIATWGSYH